MDFKPLKLNKEKIRKLKNKVNEADKRLLDTKSLQRSILEARILQAEKRELTAKILTIKAFVLKAAVLEEDNLKLESLESENLRPHNLNLKLVEKEASPKVKVKIKVKIKESTQQRVTRRVKRDILYNLQLYYPHETEERLSELATTIGVVVGNFNTNEFICYSISKLIADMELTCDNDYLRDTLRDLMLESQHSSNILQI